MTLALMTAASWETVARRSLLMALGTCSTDEYRRMGEEKMVAAQASLTALVQGRGPVAALAPFVHRAWANARRLRRQP